MKKTLLCLFWLYNFSIILSSQDSRILDCYPFQSDLPNATKSLCEAQGCIWRGSIAIPSCAFPTSPSTHSCATLKYLSQANLLECRNPRYNIQIQNPRLCEQIGCCYDYRLSKCVQRPFFNTYELHAMKKIVVDSKKNLYKYDAKLILPSEIESGPFGNDIRVLNLMIIEETNTRIHVRITDPSKERYRVTEFDQENTNDNPNEFQKDYKVSFTESPFGIAVIRGSTNEVLFNSTPSLESIRNIVPFGGLVYENQYLEISTQLCSNRFSHPFLYGLGESISSSFRLQSNGNHYTMYSKDQEAAFNNPKLGGGNEYGYHPFYLRLEDSGKAHGVFMLSSSPIEVIIQPNALTYRIVGGIIEFYIFTGPDSPNVISDYTNFIGRPSIPPYWALGFHLCRWGYNDLATTKSFVDRMRDFKIPQDAQWNDIDYLDKALDFSLNKSSFPEYKLKAFIQDLHDNGQHYMSIYDPGISVSKTPTDSSSYEPLELGKEMDVFITKAKVINNSEVNVYEIGKVWPECCVFPDFTHPNVSEYWYQLVRKFRMKVRFDGMWIDMNEISSFEDGDDPNSICATSFSILSPKMDTGWGKDIFRPFDPFRQPYVPGQSNQKHGSKGKLSSTTISMASKQFRSLHYNLHSMYGYYETKVTNEILRKLMRKRALIVSRSTYPGSGKYGTHWLGDNKSNFSDMQYSIPGILSMNLFGLPFVGPDICGFNGNTSRELCIRWHQLGSFYPFSRNHNALYSTGQSPVDFDEAAINIIKKALEMRYLYLPYIYTLLFNAYSNGETVARPLFFEFPNDENTRDIDTQFLLGKCILVSPVLKEGTNRIIAYFPNAKWYDIWSYKDLPYGGKAQYHILDAPLSKINIHLREGCVLPTQSPLLTTKASRRNPFILTITVPSKKYKAFRGELFIDDGISLDTVKKNIYTLVKFTGMQFLSGEISLSSEILHHHYTGTEVNLHLSEIKSIGINWRISHRIYVHLLKENQTFPVNFVYEEKLRTLRVFSLHFKVDEKFYLYSQVHYAFA